MKSMLSSRLETGPLAAVLKRELHSSLINRYFQVFCGLSIVGGFTAAFFSEDTGAIALLIVQIALYFVSLFAVLAGVSSAQAEREEWPLLLTQPFPRSAYAMAKLIALLCIFGAVLVLLFLPATLFGVPVPLLARLYGQSLLLAATFLAAGLAAGFLGHDRAQGLIIGVSLWLFLLVGVDLIALFAARFAPVQGMPDLWVALLMANPLDAFRVEALFSLRAVPPELASKTPLAQWWIEHTQLWFAVIAAVWTVLFMSLAARRIAHWEE